LSDTAIDQVLDRIRESSQNSREVGDKFERMMLAFFRLDRSYAAQFEEVWLWTDWSGNEGKPDTGIDLVAKNAHDDGFTAIQCKCYAPNTRLEKSDIDSFFTASGKAAFSSAAPRLHPCTTALLDA
jgi:predicted helicase